MKRERKLTEQEELDEEARRRAAQAAPPGVGAYFEGQLGLAPTVAPRPDPELERRKEIEKRIKYLIDNSPNLEYYRYPSSRTQERVNEANREIKKLQKQLDRIPR